MKRNVKPGINVKQPGKISPDDSVTEVSSSPCYMDEKDILPEGDQVVRQEVLTCNTILYCKHWEKTVGFYRDLLGLSVSFIRDDWFVELEVNASSRISLAAAERCTIPSVDGQGVTLSWQVENLEPVHSLLAESGTTVSEIKAHGWRLPYFYAWDPEGHRIEFWTKRKPF